MSEKELASIPGITKMIEQYKNDIKKLQEKINEHYEKLTKIYFKLRKILEDKENHEEKLICNPLKKEKEKEYKKLLNDYKNKKLDFQNEDEKHNKNIDKKYQDIKFWRDKLLDLEKAKENADSENFEIQRRANLSHIMTYIQQKDDWKESLNVIKKYMGESNTNQK